MHALWSAATALVPLMLTGCSLYNNPTTVALKRCVVIGQSPLGQPLSVLVKAFAANGAEARWERGRGRTYILRVSKTDQLNAKTATMALEIDQQGDGLTAPDCGPGAAVITQASYNGADLAMVVAEKVVIDAIEEYLGHKLGQRPAAASSPPVPPAAIAPATEANDDMAAEAKAEGEVYAQLADKAAGKELVIGDTTTRYCCLTLGAVVDHLRAQGAAATIDTTDDGRTVWVEAKAQVPLWRGSNALTFTFSAVGNGATLRLDMIEDGTGKRTGPNAMPPDEFLLENFELTKRPS